MIGDIRKFRFWCQKVLPLVYDDSLSYYEVLCKIVQYLNKVIEDVNSIPEYIDAVITERLSDEHLQELIEQFLVNMEKAISSNNEGTNTNSSADYNVGQMLWWKGELYKVIRQIDTGDTLIAGTNIELVSFDELFNEFMDEIKHNISANDDGASATATQNWTAGTWVWLNDVLYKAKVDIAQGTAYVLSGDNANMEQITVEGEVHSNETAIANVTTDLANEAEARADADTALDGRIDELETNVGDLDDLNTTDKTNLVSAINEVLDEAGIYNNSTPDSGLTTNIGLAEGTYNVENNLTINAELVVPKGAVINIASGVTVTINGYISAGLYRIFSGDGTVVINGNSEVYPEWWGAVNDGVTDSTVAIQKAIDAISKGNVILQSGKYNIYTTPTPLNGYVVTDTLELTKSFVGIKGVHRACIVTTAETTLEITGSTDNGSLNFVQGNYIENVVFFYNSNLVQPAGYNAVVGIKNHGSIRNYIKFCEFYNFYTAYYTDTIVANYFINNTVHVPDFVYCTGVYLNDNIINSAIYPNASQHIEDSIFLCGNSSVGITAIGDILSDLFVRNNEFGGGYRAVSMSIGDGSTATKTSYDIHITDNICDNIASTCIECSFSQNENSALLISRNWIAHKDSSAIVLQNVHNANISDNVINGTLGANTYGMAIVYGKNIIVKGNIFEACVRGIDTAIGELYTITDNSFVVFDDDRTYEVAFRLTSQVSQSVLGNNIIDADNGTLTNGIVVQGAPNIINWNIDKNTTDNIASGNIVNGVTI